MRYAACLLFLSLGCTARIAPAGSPERCARLDDRRQVSGAVWKGSAVLSAGLTTPALLGSDDDPGLRRGLAAGALGAAVVTAAAAYLQEGAGESLARDCR